jgi:hypothetical protein
MADKSRENRYSFVRPIPVNVKEGVSGEFAYDEILTPVGNLSNNTGKARLLRSEDSNYIKANEVLKKCYTQIGTTLGIEPPAPSNIEKNKVDIEESSSPNPSQ